MITGRNEWVTAVFFCCSSLAGKLPVDGKTHNVDVRLKLVPARAAKTVERI